MLKRAGILGDAADEDARCGCAHLVSGLVHRGKGRIGQLGDIEVVEANDRNIFGTPQSRFAYGLQHAEGNHVIRGDDRGRAR